MKKMLSLLAVIALAFSLAACGGNKSADNAETKTPRDGTEFGIDLVAEGTQPMTEAKATAGILKKTVEEYLEGATLFKYSNDGRTYGDFADYIGCDATEYQYSADRKERTYIWRAVDDSTAWFAVTFAEEEDVVKLYAASSANLGLSVNQ